MDTRPGGLAAAETHLKKHPGLVRYTIDVMRTLSILEDDEADGDSPVVEGYSVEHALERALAELYEARKTLKDAYGPRKADGVFGHPILVEELRQPKPDQVNAIGAVREASGMGLRHAKNVVQFVLQEACTIDTGTPARDMEASFKKALESWATDAGYTKQGVTGSHLPGCACGQCLPA